MVTILNIFVQTSTDPREVYQYIAVKMGSSLKSILDPIFQKQVDNGSVPGAAAIALDKDGTVLFNEGYGNTTAGDTSSPKVTTQTPALIWSCTKLVTCVALLQLVEQGKLDLHDPVEKFVPAIKDIQLLQGWNDDGSPKLAPPKKAPEVIHLFTHTTGFSYDFFDANTLKWRIAKEQPPVSYLTRSAMDEYNVPLVFEPGSQWEYGCNQEWMGFIIEKISGLGLAEYVDKHISQPLGLKNTGKSLTEEQDKNFFVVHAKDSSGKLTPTPTRMVQNPEVVPGGHYLYSTVEDYTNFLLALLNDGTHPKSKGTILKPESVQKYLFKDMLPEVGAPNDGVGEVPSTIPQASNTGSFLPGVKKGWSLGGLINLDPAPNGRSAGSMAWAGLGNCYFWVDPQGGKLGYVVSAILPFFDKDVLHLADALERAVYGKEQAKEIGEKGSNFEGGENKVDPS